MKSMQARGLDIDHGYKETGETISDVLEEYFRHAKTAHAREERNPEAAREVELALQEI